jgi:hypothetical protein
MHRLPKHALALAPLLPWLTQCRDIPTSPGSPSGTKTLILSNLRATELGLHHTVCGTFQYAAWDLLRVDGRPQRARLVATGDRLASRLVINVGLNWAETIKNVK